MRSVSKHPHCRDRFGHWAETEALESLVETGQIAEANFNIDICPAGHAHLWRVMNCRCVFTVEADIVTFDEC
jgi:hypothetical protein